MERLDRCNGECKRDLRLFARVLRFGCCHQSFGCYDHGDKRRPAMVHVLLHNGRVILASSHERLLTIHHADELTGRRSGNRDCSLSNCVLVRHRQRLSSRQLPHNRQKRRPCQGSSVHPSVRSRHLALRHVLIRLRGCGSCAGRVDRDFHDASTAWRRFRQRYDSYRILARDHGGTSDSRVYNAEDWGKAGYDGAYFVAHVCGCRRYLLA